MFHCNVSLHSLLIVYVAMAILGSVTCQCYQVLRMRTRDVELAYWPLSLPFTVLSKGTRYVYIHQLAVNVTVAWRSASITRKRQPLSVVLCGCYRALNTYRQLAVKRCYMRVQRIRRTTSSETFSDVTSWSHHFMVTSCYLLIAHYVLRFTTSKY